MANAITVTQVQHLNILQANVTWRVLAARLISSFAFLDAREKEAKTLGVGQSLHSAVA